MRARSLRGTPATARSPPAAAAPQGPRAGGSGDGAPGGGSGDGRPSSVPETCPAAGRAGAGDAGDAGRALRGARAEEAARRGALGGGGSRRRRPPCVRWATCEKQGPCGSAATASTPWWGGGGGGGRRRRRPAAPVRASASGGARAQQPAARGERAGAVRTGPPDARAGCPRRADPAALCFPGPPAPGRLRARRTRGAPAERGTTSRGVWTARLKERDKVQFYMLSMVGCPLPRPSARTHPPPRS